MVKGSRPFVRTLGVCLLFALAGSHSTAFGSDRTIAQYVHTAWGPKDGAPTPVRALAQTLDGYLWLGSSDGLYRFDGVVFERYQPQSGGPLPAADVESLFASSNGDLWIGFRRGKISLLRNGNATSYTPRDGVPDGNVWGIAEDREGTIWASTESGLARLEGARWKQVGRDWNFSAKTANAIFVDKQGILWVSTEDTLVFLPSGATRFQSTGLRVGMVPEIAQAPNGKLWMAETTRSVRPVPLSGHQQPGDEAEIRVGSQRILFDNDGALWVTTLGDGLRRSPAPELLTGKVNEFSAAIESFMQKDGLSDDVVRAILQDHEGNIWVGTNSGLDRFCKSNLAAFVRPFNSEQGIWVGADAGDAWLHTDDFMFRIQREQVDRGISFRGTARSAYRAPDGAIWWLFSVGMYRYQGNSYTSVALPKSFPNPYLQSMVVTEDHSGSLWLAAQRQGIFHRVGETWQRLDAASEFANLSPATAFTDWTGRVWFGYEGGAILLLKDGHLERAISAGDSPVGSVAAIEGRGHHVWIGGELGLALYDGNRFRRIIPADADTFGSVMGVEETPDGSLWMAGSRGIVQVAASEVRQTLNSPSYRVRYRVFDSFDGLPGTFVGAPVHPREIQGTGGGLWFAASRGFVWVNPPDISTNVLPPPVAIRFLAANGRQLRSLADLALPPRTTNLQIGYTALSLSVPEKVRFRYLLEGVDSDWQDAGTRREAFYTRLGPGKYHFRVVACNNDGIWNETGASLNFSIAPAYYQTAWFRALYGVAFLAILWIVYRLRVRQLQRRFDIGLEARVSERTRIARDLHDTLLQSFNALLLRLQTVSNVLPANPDEGKRRIDGAIEQASTAIAEGRDAVHELRSGPVASIDLEQAISSFAKELRSALPSESAPEIHIEVQGEARVLNPEARDEAFRIAAESLRNAIRHAHARRIEVGIRYDEHQFELRIRDDGKGIDPSVLGDHRTIGHWGLHGMRERIKLVGGTLEVWSQVSAGTEIAVTIPAANIYAKPPSARWPISRFGRR